jgi:mannose-6-phosphate isomerase-like protein (cupin superfamily)/putative sterol carrier protein
MKHHFSQNYSSYITSHRNHVLISKTRRSAPRRKFEGMAFFLLIIFAITSCNNEQSLQSKEVKQDRNLNEVLTSLGSPFVKKIDKEYQAIVNFTITDSEISKHIIISEGQFQVYDSLNADANFTFKSSLEHYNKIIRGEITGFTSMGRANMSDSTPLDFEFHKPVTDNPMNDLLFFVQRFFNPSPNDKVILSKENSRIVHGGHAIPLFYQMTDQIGVRSAWYQIEKGQQVNEPGDTNPFPQYFIMIKGVGFARIGQDTLRVKENEAYYIAPGLDHIFWTDSEKPMEMIFLAWGEGA